MSLAAAGLWEVYIQFLETGYSSVGKRRNATEQALCFSSLQSWIFMVL